MAVVASATGVALGMTAGTIGAGLVGGAVLGMGAGALYSAVTGDGNILNSALTGAMIGGSLGAAGAGVAGLAAAEGATAAGALAGAVGAATASPALQAAGSLTSSNVAGLNQAALAQGVFAEGSAALPGAGLAAAPEVVPSVASTVINPTTGLAETAAKGMSAKDMLGYGLAGSAAMSLLGGKKQSGISGSNTGTSGPQMIRPYEYSQTKNPNYGQPGEPYFIQSYKAGDPYKAAGGGLMAIGGGVGNMYPQSQQEHTNFATPTQMPTSAEVVNADFDPVTDPYTGQMPRYAEGGLPEIPQMPPPVQPARLVEPTTTYTQAPQAPTQLQQQIANYNRNIADSANQEYNVAPPPLAGLPGGGQGASESDLKKIINQYYVQNVGRQGEDAGLTDWASRVKNTGMSLADVSKGIRSSNEGVVYQGYKNLLQRAPDAPGAAYWTERLQSGVSPADFQKSLKESQEYLKLNPPTPVSPDTGSGVSQADIDAYIAAHPTDVRTYNPVTQSYGTTTPTADQVAAWKKTQVSNTMFTAPDGSLWSNKEAYDRTHPVGEAAGGLLHAAAGGIMGSYAMGGRTYNLGGYSDGGRLLKGPGDGMSDNIPASIADKQPARLADGEFVVPADVVSHLGNGSTDAGAKRLYSMMDTVRKARTGNKKQGKQIKADKYLPT